MPPQHDTNSTEHRTLTPTLALKIIPAPTLTLTAATLTLTHPNPDDVVHLPRVGVQRHLGVWMLEAASRGALVRLPLGNVSVPPEEAAGEREVEAAKGMGLRARVDDVLPLGPVQL